jgi:hypothetical protein
VEESEKEEAPQKMLKVAEVKDVDYGHYPKKNWLANICSYELKNTNRQKIIDHGKAINLSDEQIQMWLSIAVRESNYCNMAQNPGSTAYGIGQFLNMTWTNYGWTKTSDADKQIDYMYQYMLKHHGGIKEAYEYKNTKGTY